MARRRQGAGETSRVRVTVVLDAGLARRLGAYAAFHGRTLGDVVASALIPQLRGFAVSQRGTGDAPVVTADSPEPGEALRVVAVRSAG